MLIFNHLMIYLINYNCITITSIRLTKASLRSAFGAADVRRYALRFDIDAQRRIEFDHVYIQMHSSSYSSFTVTYLAGRAIAWMNIAHSLRKPSQPCCEGFFNVKKLSDVLWNIKLMPKPGALG
jgi:hypothetical protein